MPARNEGIAGAYNYALRRAKREGFAWMLTLDQDTQLPPEFLLGMRAIALRLQSGKRSRGDCSRSSQPKETAVTGPYSPLGRHIFAPSHCGIRNRGDPRVQFGIAISCPSPGAD